MLSDCEGTLADLGADSLGPLVGHSHRGGVVHVLGFGPEQQDIDSAVWDAVGPQLPGGTSGGMSGIPGAGPRSNALGEVHYDLRGHAGVDIGPGMDGGGLGLELAHGLCSFQGWGCACTLSPSAQPGRQAAKAKAGRGITLPARTLGGRLGTPRTGATPSSVRRARGSAP